MADFANVKHCFVQCTIKLDASPAIESAACIHREFCLLIRPRAWKSHAHLPPIDLIGAIVDAERGAWAAEERMPRMDISQGCG